MASPSRMSIRRSATPGPDRVTRHGTPAAAQPAMPAAAYGDARTRGHALADFGVGTAQRSAAPSAAELRPTGAGRPLPPINLLGDFAAGGMLCAMGVFAALLQRERGDGRGQGDRGALGAELLRRVDDAAPLHRCGAAGRPRRCRTSPGQIDPDRSSPSQSQSG